MKRSLVLSDTGEGKLRRGCCIFIKCVNVWHLGKIINPVQKRITDVAKKFRLNKNQANLFRNQQSRDENLAIVFVFFLVFNFTRKNAQNDEKSLK